MSLNSYVYYKGKIREKRAGKGVSFSAANVDQIAAPPKNHNKYYLKHGK